LHTVTNLPVLPIAARLAVKQSERESVIPTGVRSPQTGFTMVELIVVMIIIGILSAVGLARFIDRKSFDADEFVGQAKSMLRYGQKVAIAQNRPVYVRLNGASIALCFDSACASANRVQAPGGTNTGSSATLAACSNDSKWQCEAVPANVSYTLAPSAPYTGANNFFYFDALGKPYAAADATTSATSTFAPLTISISADSTRSIVVEQETGYVH
jgi:MSHA pilin protein MshC